ncbi:MAG: hypothetical protein AAF512_02050 [Pseudomonadota bacterium]
MADFKNARLIWRLWSDTSFGGSITSTTSEAGNMLKENLQSVQPSEPWRSNGFADQTIVFDLGTPRPIRGLYIGKNNFDPGDTVQLEIATDSGFSNIIHDETFEGKSSVYGLGEQPLGTDGLGGYDDDAVDAPYNLKWFEEAGAQYARVTLSGKTSGYYQMGRIALFDWFSPEGGNIAWGYDLDVEQLSSGQRGQDGAWFANDKGDFRRITGRWENALTANDEKELYQMRRKVKNNLNVIWCGYPESSDETEEQNHTFLGVVESMSGVSRSNAIYRNGAITIAEVN